MTVNPAPLDTWLLALRHSHDRLVDLIGSVGAEGITARAFPSEWSVAQVLSHLGSSAEIFGTYLTAGQKGSPAEDGEGFTAVWDVWNAKSPGDQVRDGLEADRSLLDRLDALDSEARRTWQLDLFGASRRLVDLVAMRLNEHALHTWDVAVVLDDSATISPDAVELVVDELGLVAQYTARAPAAPLTVPIRTDEPTRDFRLEAIGDAVRLVPVDAASPRSNTTALHLPAEALIRLIYGRLDEVHTPSLVTQGVDIATLRRIFPGP